MHLRVALAFLLAVSPTAPALAASLAPYDAKAAPLDALSQELLTGHGYELRGDGKVVDKIAESPVRAEEMPYLLSRLASARRLKVLLELNLLLNRSAGEKKLTADEREAVRTLVRQNWAILPPGTRKDFRAYFTPEELHTLNQIPPRFDRASALLMRDPEPLASAVAPGAAPATFPITGAREAALLPAPDPGAVAAAPAAPAPRPKAYYRPTQVLTPLLPPLSLRRPSPYVTELPPEPAPEPAPAYAPAAAPPVPAQVATAAPPAAPPTLPAS
ncbi:MAG: hypothetical protein SF051_10265, partial [Elusimicrobiota bacterium]|nr:hypothetical protein [Elusimicrobiota bacterium]